MPILLDCKPSKTALQIKEVHTSYPCFLPTMPTIVCLGPVWMSCWTAAALCSMDSSYTEGGYNCSVLHCKMAGVMTPETWYSHTQLLWYLWRVLSTIHCPYLCLILGLIVLIIMSATAVHRFLGFWKVSGNLSVLFCIGFFFFLSLISGCCIKCSLLPL